MRLNAGQQSALTAVTGTASVALFGPAGTGKTAVRDAVATQSRAILLGPTGASVAGKPGAMTIAKFMGATPATVGDPSRLSREMRGTEAMAGAVLVIDEISMVAGDVFAALSAALCRLLGSSRPFGGMQVLLLGDIFQLRPPVAGPYFFETAAFAQLVQGGLVVLGLTQQMRQTKSDARAAEFGRFLACARASRLDAAATGLLAEMHLRATPPNALHLFARRQPAEAHNQRMLKAWPGKVSTLAGVALKLHAPVFATRNRYGSNKRLLYANGDSGLVVAIAGQVVVVAIRGERHAVGVGRDGSLPLALGWATTVHKAQGRTVGAVVIHGENMFDAGQAYVAASRVRSFAGLAARGLEAGAFELPFPQAVRDFACTHGLE